jgi:hypothetical protein
MRTLLFLLFLAIMPWSPAAALAQQSDPLPMCEAKDRVNEFLVKELKQVLVNQILATEDAEKRISQLQKELDAVQTYQKP